MSFEIKENPRDQSAWERFLEIGIPTKANEAYRYVHLKDLLSHSFFLETVSEVSVEPVQNQLVFINGLYCSELSRPPDALIALPLSAALKTYGNFLNARMMKLQKEERDPFALINSAYFKEGLFLYLPPKIVCHAPVNIVHLVNGLKQSTLVLPRIHLFLGKASSLSLTFEQNVSQQSVWINSLIDCALEESAALQFDSLFFQQNFAHDFLAFRATLKNYSKLKLCSATNGAVTSRHDYLIRLLGESSEASLNGLWELQNERQHHVHVEMEHQEAHATSLQKFKGVLHDQARSSFEGKIHVHQKAQKTQAYQMNHNLILGPEASANCKPNLEIFADDVKASHGATIGQIDEEHLFYFKARGIPEERARRLLVKGFSKEILELFQQELKEKALRLF